MPSKVCAPDIAQCRPGPSSVEELFRYPITLVDEVLSHEELGQRLRKNAGRKLQTLRTLLCGMLTVETAFGNLEKVLRLRGILPNDCPFFVSLEACDHTHLDQEEGAPRYRLARHGGIQEGSLNP